MIHICVAKKVNEYLKMPDKMLFLGTLAPDLSKELNDSRKKSHFYEQNSVNLEKFVDKYKYKLWDPYVMGYFVHLFTDKIWEETFVPKFVNNADIKLQHGGMSLSSLDVVSKLIYEDCTNLGTILIDKYEPKLSLFYDDLELPKVIVDEVDTNKLDILINKMSTIIANAKKEKAFIFDWSDVISFIDEVSNYIINYIKKYDL